MTSESANTTTTSASRLLLCYVLCVSIAFSKAVAPMSTSSKLRGTDSFISDKIFRLRRVTTTPSRRQLGFLNKDCTTIKKKKKRKLCKKKQRKAAEKAAQEAEVEGKTDDDENGGGGALPQQTTATPASAPTSAPISSPTSSPISLPTSSPTFKPTSRPSKAPVGAASPRDCGETPPRPNPMGPGGKGGGGGGGKDGTWVWLTEYCVWFKYSTPRGGVGSTDKSCNPDKLKPETNVDGQTSYFPCPVPAAKRTKSGLDATKPCLDSHDCETGCCMRAGVVSPTAVIQVNMCLYHEAQGSFNQCVYETTDDTTSGRTSSGSFGNPLGGGGDDTVNPNPDGKIEGEPCGNSTQCMSGCCADFHDFGVVCVGTFGYENDRCISG